MVFAGDSSFLIKSFKQVHNSMGDIAYLLNKNKIVAISDGFQQKFAIDSPELLLGYTFSEQNFPKLNMHKAHAGVIEQQNASILNEDNKKIFLEVINYQDTADIFIVHKTPVITADSQFIHARLRPLVIARLANLAAKIFNTGILPENVKEVNGPILSAKQRMVIYLYLRNYSYTEISTWMTAFGSKISAARVIEHLNRIKELVGAKDKDELRQLALKFGYDLVTPTELMPEGSYEVTNDIYNLWLC